MVNATQNKDRIMVKIKKKAILKVNFSFLRKNTIFLNVTRRSLRENLFFLMGKTKIIKLVREVINHKRMILSGIKILKNDRISVKITIIAEINKLDFIKDNLKFVKIALFFS
jgi:hypothetical protein